MRMVDRNHTIERLFYLNDKDMGEMERILDLKRGGYVTGQTRASTCIAGDGYPVGNAVRFYLYCELTFRRKIGHIPRPAF
jgi:hypothetical protein